jgi:pimeloyl-ACP methyl ester carboxylesterase
VDDATITVDGQRLGYGRSAGSGRAVVFVHGNSSSSGTWRQLLAGPFGQRYRCLALDLPGHGRSAPASDHATYSLPGYASALGGFCRALGADDAVIVGWSLGGHIALEAAPRLPDAPGFLIFGTPPVATAAQMPEAFLPNPTLNAGFTAEVSRDDAVAYASSFLAPGSALPLDDPVTDILRTDGAARAGLFASVGEGRFADEVAIVAALGRPLAVLHGDQEQLVSLDYLAKLTIPSLWRGAVQIVPWAGHAPHLEAPEKFTNLLEQFIADVG